MSKDNDSTGRYSNFRNPFSFGKKDTLSNSKTIDNSSVKKENVDNKESTKKKDELIKPKIKKSALHSKRSFSISVSLDEYNYWKKVAEINKKSLSALVRDIVNEQTEYEYRDNK